MRAWLDKKLVVNVESLVVSIVNLQKIFFESADLEDIR